MLNRLLIATGALIVVGLFSAPVKAAVVECTLDGNENGCDITLPHGKGFFSCIEDTNWATADINLQVYVMVAGTRTWTTDLNTTWDAAFGDVTGQPINYQSEMRVRLVMTSYVADDVDCSIESNTKG